MALNIAAMQQPVNVVDQFIEGRALRQAEDMRTQQMTALQNAEGRAQSQDVREQGRYDDERKANQIKFDEITGKKILGRAQQVMALPKDQRKAFIQQNAPEYIAEFEKQRGESWADIDDDEIEEQGNFLIRKISGDLGLSPEVYKAQSEQGKVASDVKGKLLTQAQGDAILNAKPSEPLEAVVGPDGKPIFTRRSASEGKTPYYQPRNSLAVTLPDGTVISEGPPEAIKPSELSKPTVNKLQETIVGAQDRLDRLNQTLSTYKPEFLQAKGLLKAKTGEIVEFFGGELDEDKKKFLSDYSEFKATAANDFNTTLRELSGSAVTVGEADRALRSAPSPEDRSPTQFEAKARSTAKTIRRAILRANYALRNGIGTKSIDELSKLIPLDAVDSIYEARANQIFEELGGTEEKRAEAIKRANQEFGIAR